MGQVQTRHTHDSWDEQKTHQAQGSRCSGNKVLPRCRPDHATEPGREPTLDAPATTETHRSVSLMQKLRDAGYKPDKVRLHVILLGVGGTIYSSMHTTFKQLGLKRQATATVAGKLHKHGWKAPQTCYGVCQTNHANQMEPRVRFKTRYGMRSSQDYSMLPR
jgi:hypothetical protein